MPKENEDTTNSEVTKTIKNHSERISKLNQRVSDISDELALLKNEISGFKRGVAKDMRNIIDTINKKE